MLQVINTKPKEEKSKEQTEKDDLEKQIKEKLSLFENGGIDQTNFNKSINDTPNEDEL